MAVGATAEEGVGVLSVGRAAYCGCEAGVRRAGVSVEHGRL